MKLKFGTQFYTALAATYTDGTMDLQDQVVDIFDTEEGAIDAARDDVEESGDTNVVYMCVPIIRVRRGKMRVTDLRK